MGVSNMTLVKIGAVGGVITASMGLLLRGKLNNNIKDSEFYKEALKTVRSHSGAVYLLGEPIKDKTIDVFNKKKNFIEENFAQFEVPISGQKQKGLVYLWAEKNSDGKWIVNRIELELANDKTKRLLIKSLKPEIS